MMGGQTLQGLSGGWAYCPRTALGLSLEGECCPPLARLWDTACPRRQWVLEPPPTLPRGRFSHSFAFGLCFLSVGFDSL